MFNVGEFLSRVVTLVLRSVAQSVRPHSDGKFEELNLQDLLHAARRSFKPLVRGTLRLSLLGSAPVGTMLGRGVLLHDRRSIRFGRGVYVGDYSYIDGRSIQGIDIADNVTLREHSWVQCTSLGGAPGYGLVIAAGTYVGPFAVLGAAGPLKIGRNCQIGAHVAFSAENHIVTSEGTFGTGVTRQGIEVCDDVWIGNGARILDGVVIGEGSVVGAGAVVTRSVESRTIVVGVPARPLRTSR